MNNKNVIFDKDSRANLIESIVQDAIQNALEEIDKNLIAHLECRYAWLGDSDEAYNPYKKERIDLWKNRKRYILPTNNCTYKTVYDFMENIIKEELYNRSYDDANMPIVYLSECYLSGTDIIVKMSVTLLQKDENEKADED